MKKALVVLLALAVVGGAFAEVTVGGSVEGGWQIVNSKGDGTDLTGQFGMVDRGLVGNVRPRLAVNASNEDGTLGGMLNIRFLEGGGLGNIWWQPISQMKATLGYVWGGANLTAGVANPSDVIIPIKFWGRAWSWKGDHRAMQGYGWESDQAVAIELFPMENLYIIASVPFHQTYKDTSKAADIFAQTAARFAYTITDIGQIAVTWDGGTMKNDDTAYVSAHFNLTAVENLALSVVFDLPLADDNGANTTSQKPMTAGVQAGFTAGAFQINGGVAARFLGSTTVASVKTEKPLNLGVTLNPVYDASIVKIGLIGEVNFDAASKGGESNVGFNVVPYVQKDLAGGAVYAGFQILKESIDGDLAWSIPVGFTYGF